MGVLKKMSFRFYGGPKHQDVMELATGEYGPPQQIEVMDYPIPMLNFRSKWDTPIRPQFDRGVYRRHYCLEAGFYYLWAGWN